jgi:phage terminase large subunit-like protein
MTPREQAKAGYEIALRAAPRDDGGSVRDVMVRELLLKDLFFLMVYVLGRTDMDNDWCFARCREVQASPDGHLDLWAREHYKSTIITVGLTIQEILRNPEITVGIISYNQDIASSFLIQIKRIFEDNDALKWLFPDVLWTLPVKEAPQWNTEALVVKRTTVPQEATVEALPLHKGTGKHFSLLIYDDVVTQESVTTPEQIKKTTENWQLSQNIGAIGGKVRMIGTRYHAADTYKYILEETAFRPRIYPATADGTYEGKPVFMTREALAEKRQKMGPFIFACQMLQNPLADKAQGFAEEWFMRLPGELPDAKGMNRYIIVDPASAKKKDSDYTSMWVVGMNIDNNYYILDGVHDRLNLVERGNALFELHRKWLPLRVGYEHYGMQADVEHLRYRMEQENYRFGIIELGGQTPKTDRIRRLVPVFEQGRIWFPYRLLKMRLENTAYDLTDEFLKQEYMTFPVSAHDDMLDCLSRILDAELGATFPLIRRDAYGLPGMGSGSPYRAVQHDSLWD